MKNDNKKNKAHFIFEQIFEVVAWIRIVISPTLIGIIFACLIYFPNPSDLTLIMGSTVALLGFIIGIIWACRIWKKDGTQQFLSRTMATPDLDPKEENETKT